MARSNRPGREAMLSYRHGFHAGNAADVLKHAVFVFVLRYLQKKDGPILLLDTHAGAGTYDLASPEAEKTGEYKEGIARVLARADVQGESGAGPVPELLADYLDLVRRANPSGQLVAYPGSPALALALKREQDHAALFELHPADHAALSEMTARRRGVTVEKADGFQGLNARLPPADMRGLALIDPSYEIKSDYEKAVKALAKAWRKFATGVFILWYPVIERARVDALIAGIEAAGIRKAFQIELDVAPDAPGYGMTGSGVIVVNPPWPLAAAAQAALPWLKDALGARGPCAAGWLAAE